MAKDESLCRAQEVSIIERLRSVPENARLIVDSADGMSSSVYPVGYLCHKAAEALAEAEKQEWHSLSDDEIATIWMNESVPMIGTKFKQVYVAIEQALKEKNHG